MLLKRHYDRPGGWEPKRNVRDDDGQLPDSSKREGEVLNPPPIKHIEVKHTGTRPEQNFSEKVVRNGIKDGYVTLSRGELILHAEPEDLHYKIVRSPGWYCCHCGDEIQDAGLNLPTKGGITFGMKHVQEIHGDAASPDPSNSVGYRRVNGYETVLDADQHAKYRLGREQQEEPARPRKRRS